MINKVIFKWNIQVNEVLNEKKVNYVNTTTYKKEVKIFYK